MTSRQQRRTSRVVVFVNPGASGRASMAPGQRGRWDSTVRRSATWSSSSSVIMYLALWAVSAAALIAPALGEESTNVCQEITIPMCRGIGYNLTYMPNQFNHDTQEEAGLEVHQFWPLVEIQCSPDLKFFLCSMYAPICMTNYHKPLPACRSVCERAKAGCAPLMRQYGFAWPERMKCNDLPRYGDKDHLCMDFNITEKATPPPKTIYPALPTRQPVKPGSGSGGSGTGSGSGSGGRGNLVVGGGQTTGRDCGCKCRDSMVTIHNHTHRLFNKVSTGGQANCAVNCQGAYFSEDEQTFAQFWIGLWSVLCCISTTMTVITFFIDMQRFQYPERPIIFLSACYTMVSIGYIIRLVMGHQTIACEDYEGTSVIRYSTTGPAVCTVVFLLIYFFGMASSIWWVVLAFTWFLSAGLKWGQEAISRYSQYFHLAAWLIPSIKSIAILAMSAVDGDPVAGVCYVGNQNLDTLRGFVLAPLCVYLLVGTSFLLAGFVSLFRIRNVIKQQGGTKTDKLEKLMIRIGVFSVLYTVPASIVIGCYFYEQHFREAWEMVHNCPCSEEVTHHKKPDYSVYMLKYFMCLVVGITSGFWIWSGKTIDSWRRFYARMCGKTQYHHPSRLPQAKYTNTAYHSNKQLPLSHV